MSGYWLISAIGSVACEIYLIWSCIRHIKTDKFLKLTWLVHIVMWIAVINMFVAIYISKH
jgi:membrane-associated protease RseP (regulator of RpoE activity)